MPLKQMPQFKAIPNRLLEIQQPAIGGLNLTNLEYEQAITQSPYMLNMMYRNGALSKRYGKDIDKVADSEIFDITYYDGKIIHRTITGVYVDGVSISIVSSIPLPEKKGLWFEFHQKLYYLNAGLYELKFDETTQTYSLDSAELYVPTVLRGIKPDGSFAGVVADSFNAIGVKYSLTYNGDGRTTTYYLKGSDIDTDKDPVVEVDGVETTNFTFDRTNKAVIFNTAPAEGDENVIITLSRTVESIRTEARRILNAKYAVSFGGDNGSRLFLAGCGNSAYYYSGAYDATYFPVDNNAVLGNTAEDITGFGLQYNVLIVFKPREIYSLHWYRQSASTSLLEEEYGLEAFRTQLVNARVGCDCTYSIQLINNQLTWFNTIEGVCTLVSTNVVDERNVRILSVNINKTNNMGVKGILDFDFANGEERKDEIQSVDFESKYWLVFPRSGMAYVWDYALHPYSYYARGDTNTEKLCWFLFDNFYVKNFVLAEKELFYISNYEYHDVEQDIDVDHKNAIIKVNNSFEDLDYTGTGEPSAIFSYYMTPFIQFNAVEYLKNVKELFIQCRGDTASVIDIYYYTDQSSIPEQDTESIRIGGKLWYKFAWDTFQWLVVAWANTFRRKCNLKKIQMVSFYFENGEVARDMSITHIGMTYQLVKTVR